MILAAWYHSILATVFALIAILLMLVILLQRGKGVGLSGAFGGTGGHTTFGSKTGDFLTWVTIAGAALFLLAAVVLNFAFVPAPANLTGPTPAGPTAPAMPSQGAPAPAGLPMPPAGAVPQPMPASPPARTPAPTPPPPQGGTGG